jgi:endonuclease YncB( thermonuclease family)
VKDRVVWVVDSDTIHVRRSYAPVMTIPLNVKHQEPFLRRQCEARAAGRGLWSRV